MLARYDLAVVGVGNMGVSVLGAFLSEGHRCPAVAIDPRKVAELARGLLVVPEEGADRLFSEAAAKPAWYTQRWVIGVNHRTLKTGCRIEQRQLGTADRLEECLATHLVAA